VSVLNATVTQLQQVSYQYKFYANFALVRQQHFYMPCAHGGAMLLGIESAPLSEDEDESEHYIALFTGMTKYRKGPTKDRKGALHRTTEDRQS